MKKNAGTYARRGSGSSPSVHLAFPLGIVPRACLLEVSREPKQGKAVHHHTTDDPEHRHRLLLGLANI
jgi:hypothetical protein